MDDGPQRPTLAIELERLRLADRARRLEQVLAVLYRRAKERAPADAVPAGLIESIAGFTEELSQLRAHPAMVARASAPPQPEVEAR